MDLSTIYQITCGILYVKNYEIMDSWGRIADSILYKSGVYFSSEYFPKISSQYTLSGSLINDELKHSLQVSPENLIYTHSIQHVQSFEKEFDLFKDRICDFLIPKVVEEKKLSIRRIGIVLNCSITKEEYDEQLSKYLTGSQSFSSIRFSKKVPTRAGAKWTDKSDYINKIYSFGVTEDDAYKMIFDYQMHFIPSRQYVSDISNGVLKSCLTEFKKEFLENNSD